MRWASLLFVLILPLYSCGGGSAPASGPALVNNDGANEAPPTTSTTSPPPSPPPEPEVIAIDYGWGAESNQFGILYRLDPVEDSLPVVVMIHGGCWLDDYTLDLQTDLSIALAEEGFAVWNIEFRRLGNGGEWPVIFQDITAARDFLATLTDTYDHPLDLTAVTAMGHSSGGHLALWLAGADQLDPTSDVFSPTDIPIKGVVGLGPITDLNSPICRTSVSRLIADSGLDPTERATRIAETSPKAMLPLGIASIMISGSADAIAPPNITQQYVDAAVEAGDYAEHLVIDGADHFYLIDRNAIDISLLADSLRAVMDRTNDNN